MGRPETKLRPQCTYAVYMWRTTTWCAHHWKNTSGKAYIYTIYISAYRPSISRSVPIMHTIYVHGRSTTLALGAQTRCKKVFFGFCCCCYWCSMTKTTKTTTTVLTCDCASHIWKAHRSAEVDWFGKIVAFGSRGRILPYHLLCICKGSNRFHWDALIFTPHHHKKPEGCTHETARHTIRCRDMNNLLNGLRLGVECVFGRS